MSNPEPPKTYDEIVRHTVPNPDGSFRPDAAQVAASPLGGDPDTQVSRPMLPDEQQLFERVKAALARETDFAGVHVQVEDRQVILRGAVGDPAALARAESVAGAVEGVQSVTNHLSPRARL